MLSWPIVVRQRKKSGRESHESHEKDLSSAFADAWSLVRPAPDVKRVERMHDESHEWEQCHE
jgi:hypothetical protein